jgi:hypothetical protein
MKIGDKIKDVEDGDVYYEGIIQHLNPVLYEVTKVVGAKDIRIGRVIPQQLWYIEEVPKLFLDQENHHWNVRENDGIIKPLGTVIKNEY